jgi:hypothetical protein
MNGAHCQLFFDKKQPPPIDIRDQRHGGGLIHGHVDMRKMDSRFQRLPKPVILGNIPTAEAKSHVSTRHTGLLIGFPLHEHLDKNRGKS